MSAKIKVLPDHLINQIAAGEVVEDAASAAKELIENALDAGAKRIVVSIDKGGYERLSVVDDGCGMAADDAIICFERHATSKIREAADLFQLSTMGFRGEALAAIAAVSKVDLTTARANTEEKGTKVAIAGGRILSASPCGRASGTSIEVRNLFYNAPARRKFQPAPAVSERAILRLLTAFSLGHPHVEFILENENEPLLFAKKAENNKKRVQEILGEEQLVFEQPVYHEERGYAISGFLGPTYLHRPQRSNQYLFVEGRYVFSPLISRAVREAFSTRIPEGRHPSFVLYLKFPHGDVDVNVHPQKKEVRFRDEAFLSQFIQNAIRKTFFRLDSPLPALHPLPAMPATILPWELNETMESVSPSCSTEIQMEFPQPRQITIIGLYDKYLIVDSVSLPATCPLFAEKKQGGMVVIDLALAKMRITFETLLSQNPIAEQRLLIPKKIQMSKPESVRLQKRLADLRRIGLEIQVIGEREFLIEAMPRFWEDGDIEEALMASLEEIEKESIEKEILQRLAMRASSFIRWNKGSSAEAKAVIEELLKCEEPYFSPRGKPIMALLDERSLERLFHA